MRTERLIAVKLCVLPNVAPHQPSQLSKDMLRHGRRNLRVSHTYRTAHSNGVHDMYILQTGMQ